MVKTRKISKQILHSGVRRLFFLLSGLLSAVGGYGGYQAMAPKAQINEVTLYSYNLSADSSYTAHLISNELYTETLLAEGGLYTNNLVSHFDFVFNAQYAGDLGVTADGSYTIEAIVHGYQGAGENRQKIYERRFPLVEQTKVSGDGKVSISQSISVILLPYIEFADKAEQILGARPHRELLILFTGNFEAKSDTEKVEAPFSHAMTIPLTSELFAITKQKPYSKQNSITNTEEYILPANFTHIIPWAILALIALTLACVILIFTRKPTPVEKSRMNLKEMLRKHGSRMIRLSMKPKLADSNTQTAVSALEDLLKISDDLKRPICYSPDANGLPIEGLLYVNDGGHYYTFNSMT